MNNPELKAEAFGLDKSNPSQLYAARMLIKSTLECRVMVSDDSKPEASDNRTDSPYFAAMCKYRDNLCSDDPKFDGWSKPITAKHRLLMRNDPLIQISPGSTPSALQVLLANTHFQTGVWTRPTMIDASGKVTVKELRQNRKQFRELYIRELTRLYDNPKTHVIIAALAGVISKTDGKLIFSMSSLSTGSLGAAHNAGLGTAGFYDHNNSIITTSFINSHSLTILTEGVATIVHEALHFIFDYLVGNASSPVKDSDTAALDEAIQRDKDHRKTLNKKNLSYLQKSIWRSVVDDLENEKTYRRRTPEEAQRVMRAEIIVRPIEQLVEGASKEDIEKIMPHVYHFFKENSLPLIAAFNKSMIFETSGSLLVPTQKVAEASPISHVSEPLLLPQEEFPTLSSNDEYLIKNKLLMTKIDSIFIELKKNIYTKREDVKEKIIELLATFDEAKNEFYIQLSKPYCNLNEDYELFKKRCEKAINNATSILKKDLSLLNRVLNFFKKLFGLDALIKISPNEEQLKNFESKLFKQKLEQSNTVIKDEPPSKSPKLH